ncbi:Ubiquinone biosynthesis monooxygenase COQ6, mitochondrial [Linum grandiflorum]
MNRLVARKLFSNGNYLKVPSRKGFCSAGEAAVLSSVSTAQLNHECQNFSANDQPYDIAIVGGGMVGMALACSLATKPLTKHLNVAIIDSNPALANKLSIKREDPPHARVSTVTPATISSFQDAGAWQYVQQHRHAYFDKMQVWDYTGLGYTKYDASDVNKDVLGCVVENRVLHSSLLSRLEDTGFRKTIYPSKLASMVRYPSSTMKVDDNTKEASYMKAGLVKLEMSDGSSLYTKLVVGSDGAKSHLRSLAGFRTIGWNYSQNAIICTVEHSVENHTAWQRFLPDGPIALLPIGDNFSNIVWTMNPNQSSDLTAMNEDDFVKAVNNALDHGYGPRPKSSFSNGNNRFSLFGGNLTMSSNESFEVPPKVVKLASKRTAFPLSLMHANDYVAKRIVLIGDAAHAVHPLAGQGVNLGFGDAFTLSRIISEGIAVGADIGEVSLLRKYERERKPANVAMMAVLDSFQKLYSVDFGPLNVLRAAAFNAANNFSPLKRSIISYASGEERLPIFS